MKHQHKCGYINHRLASLQPPEIRFLHSLSDPNPDDGCGFVWEHAGGDDSSHHCPRCGQGPWTWKWNVREESPTSSSHSRLAGLGTSSGHLLVPEELLLLPEDWHCEFEVYLSLRSIERILRHL